jgi:hypothetical protein
MAKSSWWRRPASVEPLLRLKWVGESKNHAEWVVAEWRTEYELLVDVSGSAAKEAMALGQPGIQVQLDERALAAQIKKHDAPSVGTVASWTVKIEPLTRERFRTGRLRVTLGQESDDGWQEIPGCQLDLALVPASQAIWCRRLLWALIGACAMLLWPIAELKASSALELAYYGAFGAPVGLLLDELRRAGKEKPFDGLYGLRPSLRLHVLLAACLLSAVLLFVRCGVVSFENQSSKLKVDWAGTAESFDVGATRTVMSLDPLAYFQRVNRGPEAPPDGAHDEKAAPVATPAARYCLSPLESCPGESAELVPKSLFRLSRTLRVVCRRQPWRGLEDLHPSGLKLADLIDRKVYPAARKDDCAPSEASAWVDAATLFPSVPEDDRQPLRSARARVLFNAGFSDLSAGARTHLKDDFATLELVTVGRDAVAAPLELPIALHLIGDGSSSYAEGQYVAAPAAKAAFPGPQSAADTAVDPILPTVQYRQIVVPAPKDAYRFSLDIGPADSSHWGTLTCYLRGKSGVKVWLLPLSDSVVRHATVSTSNDEVLSSWTLDPETEQHGDRAPVVPVCLPRSDAPLGMLKAELVVPSLGDSPDLPPLSLPKELLPIEMKLFTAAGNDAQALGKLTCHRTQDSIITRVPALLGEASLLAPDRGIDVDVHAARDSERPEGCLLTKLAAPASSFRGKTGVLACLAPSSPDTKKARCAPIAPGGKSTSTLGYSLAPEHRLARPPQAAACILNGTGTKVPACACKTASAKERLPNNVIQDAAALYGCVAQTAEYCPCAP